MPGMGSGVPVGAPPTVRTAIKPNLKASPHSHPTRVLLQSISGVEVQYPGKGSGFTCRSTARGASRNQTEPHPKPAAHAHATPALLQAISGVGVQCPERDLVLPVGAPHRCEPQSNQTSEPAPFAPDTGAPTVDTGW